MLSSINNTGVHAKSNIYKFARNPRCRFTRCNHNRNNKPRIKFSAKVKFIISNRSADTISEIKVQNIDCTIESQNYNNGVTEVIAEISNPILYVSNYSLESISTKNQFNMTYTRDFKTGERNIAIEFYREINNIDDWYSMNNSTTENYRLMQDLDFRNNQNKICIGNTLTGKIDGNNHTISNIQNTHVFYNIKGSLKNLNISNVSMSKTATSLGIILMLIQRK